jgi:ribosomal protein L37AE/L43A
MAKVECPKCHHTFEGSALKGLAAASAASAIGAYFGSSVGIAMGSFGAIAGTIPSAIVGATVGYLSSNKFYQCEKCDRYFML